MQTIKENTYKVKQTILEVHTAHKQTINTTGRLLSVVLFTIDCFTFTLKVCNLRLDLMLDFDHCNIKNIGNIVSIQTKRNRLLAHCYCVGHGTLGFWLGFHC